VSDLKLIGRSEDGSELELKDQEGATYTLRISDHLRSLVNQPRLVAVSSPNDQTQVVTVKEVQARLRSGESADSLMRTTGWSSEKIEKFSGPIMQERAYIIELALAANLTKEKHSPTLATATIAQLSPRGVDMDLVEWNTWRKEDGSWNIILMYPLKDGGQGEANWNFELASRTLEAEDDGALWISGEERIARPSLPTHGMVFPSETAAPRLVAVREEIETIRITTTPTSTRPTNTLETIFDSAPHNPSKSASDADEEIPADAKRDGVTKRLKIPSWDDIMFGSKSDNKSDNSSNKDAE
jgi:hypothetical protein